MIQIGIKKRLILITGKLIPGKGRHFLSSHEQKLQMDPNLELPDEMWRLIMDMVEDPADKKSLENASSRLKGLFRNENTKWLFPLALPILMKYCKNEGILNGRAVSCISCQAIDKYIDKMFSESDAHEYGFEYLKPLKLSEIFGSMETWNKYLNEGPGLPSTRTPRMTRLVSVSPLSFDTYPENRISIPEIRRIFTFLGGNIRGVEIGLDGDLTLQDLKEIFEIIFLQAPKLEKLFIVLDPLVEIVEEESLLILDSPPQKLKYLNLAWIAPHLTNHISFRRIFTQVEFLEGYADIFLMSKADLGALENVETILSWDFNVNPIEGRQRLYQGLIWLYAPKLRKIVFHIRWGPNVGLRELEIWKVVKKRLLAIIRHKYRDQRTCRATIRDIDWYKGEEFIIFLD